MFKELFLSRRSLDPNNGWRRTDIIFVNELAAPTLLPKFKSINELTEGEKSGPATGELTELGKRDAASTLATAILGDAGPADEMNLTTVGKLAEPRGLGLGSYPGKEGEPIEEISLKSREVS